MRTGFWLALLPSLLMLIGALRGARATWRRPSIERLFVLGLALGMSLSLVHLSLRYPSYGTAKAFYVHQMMLPFCLAFGLGFEWVRARSRWLGHAAAWGIGVWALTAYASFWIASGSTATLLPTKTLISCCSILAAARASMLSGERPGRVSTATVNASILPSRVNTHW